MGRLYKTDKPTFVDNKMFQVPADLMFKVALKKEADIDKNLADLETLKNNLAITPHKKDDTRYNEIVSELNTQIDETTKGILDNPNNYKNQMLKIKELQSKTRESLTNGELAKIKAVNIDRDKEKARIIGLKKMSPIDRDLGLRYTEAQFEGTNYKGVGEYNTYPTNTFVPYKDFNQEKFLNSVATNYEPEITSKNDNSTKGGVIKTTNGVIKIRDGNDVAAYVLDNPEVREYYQQMVQRYRMKEFLGESNSELSPEERAALDIDDLVGSTKRKLGYKHELIKDNITQKKVNSNASKNSNGTGVIAVTDYDANPTLNSAILPISDRKMKNPNNTVWRDQRNKYGNNLAKGIFNEVKTGELPVSELNKKLKESEMTKDEFVAWTNYHLNNLELKEISTNVKFNKQVIDNINSISNLDKFDKFIVKNSHGKTTEIIDNTSNSSFTSLLQDESIYTPITNGKKETTQYIIRSGTQLLDIDGIAMKDPNTGGVINFPEDKPDEEAITYLKSLGLNDNIPVKEESKSYVRTNKSLFKASKGNTRRTTWSHLNGGTKWGSTGEDKYYTVTQEFTKTNKKGEIETVVVTGFIKNYKIRFER